MINQVQNNRGCLISKVTKDCLRTGLKTDFETYGEGHLGLLGLMGITSTSIVDTMSSLSRHARMMVNK